MRDTTHRQRSEVGPSKRCASIVETASCDEPAPRRDHLHVEQVRSRQPLTCKAVAMSLAVAPVIGESRYEDAGVDDDQRESRSARTAFTASREGTFPPARWPARSSTSSRVGVLASSIRWASRYSCSDMPADAARFRSVACTSSGTSLTWMLGIRSQ